MKRLWLILLVIPIFAQKEYDITHITEKNGLYIKKFSDEKVNGEVFQMFGDMKVPLGKMKDGKMDGKWTQWYKSGGKKSQSNYKNGDLHGLSNNWYKNGKKREEENYKDGKADGLFTLWYENGSKKSERKYKDGRRVSIIDFKRKDN